MTQMICSIGEPTLWRSVASVLAIGSIALDSQGTAAQDYPSKPIHFIAGEAAGTADIAARLIARGLARGLGQQVIVENRGGSGVIRGQALVLSQPDGYTVLLYSSAIWLLPLLQDNVPFDPVRDFASITLVLRTPMILVVNPSLPVKSVKELITLAKTRPGELNYGSSAFGGANHLSPELFKSMAQVNIVHITYKGIAPALTDLISGRLQVMFPAIASGMSHVKAGRLRALAVTTAQPTALGPGLPTIAAAGLPGYEASLISALFAPARTPPAIVNRLNEEMVRVLNEPEVKEKLFSVGIETVGSSPEELTETAKLEVAKWGKLIKEAGIRSY